MSVTAPIKFMDMRRLQEESAKYGCVIERHHYRRKVFTMRTGGRWTYLKDPVSGLPIQKIRDVTVSAWKESIRIGAAYLHSDDYAEIKD